MEIGRIVLGVVAGVVIAGLIVFAVEWVGHQVYPPPADLDPNDMAAISRYVATMPVGAFLFVLLGWTSGTFVGTYAGTLIANGKAVAGYVAGAINVGFAVLNVILIPHPVWFVIVGLGLTAGAAWAAVRLAAR